MIVNNPDVDVYQNLKSPENTQKKYKKTTYGKPYTGI